jgi:uncharacterized membrane protein YeaQ/YmgE (transglycosylase-associated protein family)
MFHLIWYILIGLVAGVIAKAIMHVHLALIWTIALGIIGSILGGTVTHMFSRPREGVKFHPAGLIFSVLGSVRLVSLPQAENSFSKLIGHDKLPTAGNSAVF